MTSIRNALTATLLGAAIALTVSAYSGETTAAPASAAAQAAAPAPILPAAAPSVVASQAAAPVSKAASTTKARPTTKPTTTSKPKVDTSRCTNRIDYSQDPRDNATINSIGEDTGRCPTPRTTSHQVGSGYDPTDPGYQGADDPGTAAGRPQTSGETQFEWGCRQGYITEGC